MRRASELDASCLCCRDALLLALADVGAFRLGDIGKNPKHKVADERRGQSLSNRRVKNRHVQNPDMNTARFNQFAPNSCHFLVVSTESVKTRYDKDIIVPQFPHQLFPGRTIEVTSTFVVDENELVSDANRMQCVHLPGDVLPGSRNARIAVCM